MAQFKLVINCDNADFDDDKLAAIARILRSVAKDLDHSYDCLPIRDSNGNRIGQFELVTIRDQRIVD